MTLKDMEDKMPKAETFVKSTPKVGANLNCTSLDSCDYRKGSCVTPVKD